MSKKLKNLNQCLIYIHQNSRSSSLMQIVPILGFTVSPASEDVVWSLTVKHSSSSSILSERMGIEIHSDWSLSSSASDL